MAIRFNIAGLITAAVLLTGCVGPYEPVAFAPQGDRIVLRGVIDHTSIDAFNEAVRANPSAKTLVLQLIEGSVDDETNLELGRMVHRMGFTTIVPSNGLVASGGTDLFLAGTTRILEPGACVGVHSWAGPFSEAGDYPRDHEEHVRYLEYYDGIGIPRDFYWYTLDAAPPEDVHWTTRAEADRYKMTTAPAPDLGGDEVCIGRLVLSYSE